MVLSLRVSRLRESATIRTMEKARELESKGVKIISLDVGEPDFPTPRRVVEEAFVAIKEGYTHYTPSRGLPELRSAIAEKLREENGIDVGPDEILVTPGSKQALFYLFLALIDEGDEVILPTPTWPSYWEMARLAGAVVKEVPPVDGFQPNVGAVEELVTDRTKMIVINSPNNPTGAIFDEEVIRGLVRIAVKKNVVLVSDEIYEKISYGKKLVSPASIPDAKDWVVTVNGFSKSLAMTGWRIGYLAGPKKIIDATAKIQQHSATCAPAFAQRALAKLLLEIDDLVKPMVEEFRRRRDYVVPELRRIGFQVEEPDGAFYVFPRIPEDQPDSDVFTERVLEKTGVSMTSGVSFGGFNRRVRISYANSLSNLKEAITRLAEFLSG